MMPFIRAYAALLNVLNGLAFSWAATAAETSKQMNNDRKTVLDAAGTTNPS